MADQTPRLALPLLAAGQAQKELFHNEALARLDAAVQPCVEAAGLDDPPVAPAPGACWVVGDQPTGDWTGNPRALALWTDGGWRFLAATEGMEVWLAGDSLPLRYVGGAWRRGELRAAALLIGGQQVVGPRGPAVPLPAGGAVVDAEARAALGTLVSALVAHGLIAAS